jgi:hypothetical protein
MPRSKSGHRRRGAVDRQAQAGRRPATGQHVQRRPLVLHQVGGQRRALHDLGQAHLAERPGEEGVGPLTRDRHDVLDAHGARQGVVGGDEAVDQAAGHVVPRRLVTEHAVEHAPEEDVGLGCQPPHDPPVEHRHPAVGQQHEVARVEVAVEDAVADQPQEPGPHQRLDQRAGRDAVRVEPRLVVDGHAVDELHREDPTPRQPWQRLGHDDALVAQVGQQVAHRHHRRQLVAQVELFGELLGQPLDQPLEDDGLLLRAAQEAGELDPTVPPDAAARFCMTLAMGSLVVTALGLAPADADDWSAVVDRLVTTLEVAG